MNIAAGFIVFILLILASGAEAEVPSLLIYCDPDEYSTMIDLWEEEIEIDCTVVNGDTVYSEARIRLRGDSSRQYPKKSYRITLPEVQLMDGRNKWNFNAEYLDETYVHSWLFAWIMEQLEYPCFSIDHVKLYVNDAYIGLYVRGEPVDEQFLIDHGMDPDANLYKASVNGACLSRYDNVTEVWSKNANEGENWTDLYELIDYLDQVDTDIFYESAGEYFDLDRLMTILAVNSLTLNYTTYYQNYFIYRDIRGTGLWTMLPWNVDKTFGDWISRSYTHGVNTDWYDNALFEKVILDPILFEVYYGRMAAIAEEVMNPAMINPVLDSLEAVLTFAVSEDTLDGITVNEFHDALQELRDNRIPGRILSLDAQYISDPRSFRAFRGDEVSLGAKFISWESCNVPSGGSVTYSVYLYTADGWPSTTYEQHHLLTDTCLTFTGLPTGDYIWRVEAKSGIRITEGYDRYNTFTVIDSPAALSGTLSGTTVLTPNQSPYHVTGDLFIPSSASLIIEEGVELRFDEGISLISQGNLRIEGSHGDSVVFCADIENKPWGGIALVNPEHEVNSIRYLSISGGTYASWQGYDFFSVLYAVEADVLIENSSFFSNEDCMYLEESSVVIRDCDFSGLNRGGALLLHYGKSALIENTVFGNMYDTGSIYGEALRFQNCSSGEFIINGCTIFNINGDGIDSDNSILHIENNTIFNCTDSGISLGKGTSGTGTPTAATLIGNIIYNCYTGVAVKDDSWAELTGCTISDCDMGIRAYIKTTGSGGGNVTVLNSIFTFNLTDLSIEDDSYAEVSYSLTGNTEPWIGEGNIAGNPEFAEWGDFRLSFNSPCIDTGSPLIEDPDGTRSDMGALFYPQVFDGLVINEVQSVNDTTIADLYGEYDDWFEIHNGSGYDCDLSWVYVSDDPANLTAYQFAPGTILPSEGYLVVWADDHPWQDGFHLPFRFSGDGDSLYISRQPVTSGMDNPGFSPRGVPSLIDSKRFGIIPTDLSAGRIPDGGAGWGILETCTPGWSNSVPVVDTGYLLVSNPFPNPSFSGLVALDITVDAGETVVSVYDLCGRLVDVIVDDYLESGLHRVYWDGIQENGGYTPTGVYLMHVMHSAGLSESRKIVFLSR